MKAARALLKNPILEEALAATEANTVTAWKAERDPAIREQLWSRMHALTFIRSNIDGAVKRELRDEPDQQQHGE